jgi:hypothetical protein
VDVDKTEAIDPSSGHFRTPSLFAAFFYVVLTIKKRELRRLHLNIRRWDDPKSIRLVLVLLRIGIAMRTKI